MNFNKIKLDDHAIGLMFMIAFCLLTAYSKVVINVAEHHLSPLVAGFYSYLITTIMFTALFAHNIKKFGQLILQNKILVLKINISTAIIWLSIFFALKYLTPIIVLSIYYGVITVTTVILTWKEKKDRHEVIFDLIVSIFLMCLLIIMIVDHLIHLKSLQQALIAAVITIIAGVAGSYNNIFAHSLYKHKFTASYVLAVRFYLALVITGTLLLITHTSINVSYDLIPSVIIIAFFTIAIPIFLLQKGIERIGPKFVSFLMPLIPVTAFFVQVYKGVPYFWTEVVAAVILSIVIAGSAIIKTHWEKKKSLVELSESVSG